MVIVHSNVSLPECFFFLCIKKSGSICAWYFFDIALKVTLQCPLFTPAMWIIHRSLVVVQDMYRPLRVQWERAYANYNLCLDGKSGDGPVMVRWKLRVSWGFMASWVFLSWIRQMRHGAQEPAGWFMWILKIHECEQNTCHCPLYGFWKLKPLFTNFETSSCPKHLKMDGFVKIHGELRLLITVTILF